MDEARAQGWRIPIGCLVIYLVVWTALAISPRSPKVWLLESLPVLVVVVVLAWLSGTGRLNFSDRTYVQGLVFLMLHTIGAHYVYTEVPLGEWARHAFGLWRNNYDRLVHFACGALLFPAAREGFFGKQRGMSLRLELFLTFALMSTWSMGYEIYEWLAAALTHLDPTGYLVGNQGDPWDSQKDMAMASLGAGLAIVVEVVLHAVRARRPAPARKKSPARATRSERLPAS